MFDGQGIVVIDTNVIRHLVERDGRKQVQRSLRAAGLVMVPSMVNLLEIALHPDDYIRNRLFAVVEALADEPGVLPLPLEVIHEIGKGLSRGDTELSIPLYSFRRAAMSAGELDLTDVTRLREAQADQKRRWRQAYADTRSTLRPYLKEEKIGDQWKSIVSFLDDKWGNNDMSGRLMAQQWIDLGLPGATDSRDVQANETWRLFFEGLGANYYEQCVPGNRERVADPNDIAQLVYMSIVRPRILVTGDGPLYRIATAVIKGRYPGARVIERDEFFDEVV